MICDNQLLSSRAEVKYDSCSLLSLTVPIVPISPVPRAKDKYKGTTTTTGYCT